MKPIAPFLLSLVLLTGCQTNTFAHKHFPERVARIHTVGLWPQVHTAILNSYFGTDPSPSPFPEEQQIRSKLIASTMDQLQQRGFDVKEGSFPDGTNHIWDGCMIDRGFSLKPAKATLPDATVLATNLNVDGLIFLYAYAFKSTSHRQYVTMPQNILALLGILAGGADISLAWQNAALEIALVDGETGDVLWATYGNFDNFETNRPAKAVDDLFNRYPKEKP
jgi:hypothetical protein